MTRSSRKAHSKYGFFNLPSDEALGCPRFNSFEQREAYIRNNVPQEILDRFNQIVSADHENQLSQSLVEKNEVEEYSELDMEHSQRFLEDTKRFKALMKDANIRCEYEQDCDNIIKMDKQLLKEPIKQERERNDAIGPQIVTMIDEDLKSGTNNIVILGAQQGPLKSIRDLVNHNVPSHGPSTSSEGQEPRIDQVDQQDKGTSSKFSTLHDKSPIGSSPLKRKNKYLEPCADENTFQQLPLKTLTHPKKKIKISGSRIMELQDHLKLLETVFVGETTSQFVPLRGDLIVIPPHRAKEMISQGYLTSYEGLNTHKFEHGELVVRIGYYEEIEQRKYLHQPYKNLELYAYNREGNWRYLGKQPEMINTQIAIDDSPGKHLHVGSLVSSCQFNTIIKPRRGDVIIKRSAWIENFAHRENFRCSMVEWHTDQPVQWEPDDMLLRLFVDTKIDCNNEPFVYSEQLPSPDPGDHSDCSPHGSCMEVHAPLAPGFTELYRIEGLESKDMGWVFWGRTKHLYDTPYPKSNPLYLRLYVCDEGKDIDTEIEKHRRPKTME